MIHLILYTHASSKKSLLFTFSKYNVENISYFSNLYCISTLYIVYSYNIDVLQSSSSSSTIVRLGICTWSGSELLSDYFESAQRLVGHHGRRISPTQGLYLQRRVRHRKMTTNIHALNGIRTHDLSVKAIKAFASDRAPTGTSVSQS
jgi:hypothetical protein